MNASFHAKSAAVSLLAITAIGFYYFANVVTELDTPLQANASLPACLWQLAITTIVLLIILEVTLHIVLPIGARQVATSHSRDRGVVGRAMCNAYIVLTAGVLVS